MFTYCRYISIFDRGDQKWRNILFFRYISLSDRFITYTLYNMVKSLTFLSYSPLFAVLSWQKWELITSNPKRYAKVVLIKAHQQEKDTLSFPRMSKYFRPFQFLAQILYLEISFHILANILCFQLQTTFHGRAKLIVRWLHSKMSPTNILHVACFPRPGYMSSLLKPWFHNSNQANCVNHQASRNAIRVY